MRIIEPSYETVHATSLSDPSSKNNGLITVISLPNLSLE